MPQACADPACEPCTDLGRPDPDACTAGEPSTCQVDAPDEGGSEDAAAPDAEPGPEDGGEPEGDDSVADGGPEDGAQAEAAPDPGPDATPDSGSWQDPGPEQAQDVLDDRDAETGEDGTPSCPACAAYGAVQPVGSVSVPGLTELSGLAASRAHPGVYYAHNDSGDSTRFFAMDLSGKSRGEFRLAPGATAHDWEDMATGPCETGSCIYIGDVGDNAATRGTYTIYVVPEPETLDAAAPVTVPFTALPFRYPGGVSYNCETVLVHPSTGDVFVVTKETTWHAFRLPKPHTPGVVAEMVAIGAVVLPPKTGNVATGGSIHPCGNRVLIQSYVDLIEWTLPEGQPFDAIFGTAGAKVPFVNTGMAEAVEYEADGLGYIHVGEGADQPIHEARCEDAPSR